jgi:hypothetical protein
VGVNDHPGISLVPSPCASGSALGLPGASAMDHVDFARRVSPFAWTGRFTSLIIGSQV